MNFRHGGDEVLPEGLDPVVDVALVDPPLLGVEGLRPVVATDHGEERDVVPGRGDLALGLGQQQRGDAAVPRNAQ